MARAGPEGPRRAADGGRPSTVPSRWRGRAALLEYRSLQEGAPGLLSGTGPHVHLRPAQPLLHSECAWYACYASSGPCAGRTPLFLTTAAPGDAPLAAVAPPHLAWAASPRGVYRPLVARRSRSAAVASAAFKGPSSRAPLHPEPWNTCKMNSYSTCFSRHVNGSEVAVMSFFGPLTNYSFAHHSQARRGSPRKDFPSTIAFSLGICPERDFKKHIELIRQSLIGRQYLDAVVLPAELKLAIRLEVLAAQVG